MTLEKIGEHYLVEFVDCDPEALKFQEVVEEALVEAADEGNATRLGRKFHQFEPFGVSGIILLAESHISIHTWPEHRIAAVDIFTCGEQMSPDVIIRELKNRLGSSEVQMRYIDRKQDA